MGKFNIIYIIVAVVGIACVKQINSSEQVLPEPYQNPEVNEVFDVPVDSNSFVGLHKYIFSTTCAVSGCHDGSFEPDFRTIQSAYNTLVNHKIVKNTVDERFEYRVIPNDVANSMLYERVTTEDNVLGKMPLYDYPLTAREVSFIENWINDGAPDAFGNRPNEFDAEPSFFGYRAYLGNNTTDPSENYIQRVGAIHEPYEFPVDTTIKIWFGLYDLDANGQPFPGYNLEFNKIKISEKYYDFSNVPFDSLIIENTQNHHFAPIYNNPDTLAPYHHHYTLDTKNYKIGDYGFIRLYVQDADHDAPTEIPETGSPVYLNAYFSFKIVP